jgi:carbon-monoxide dehydrogenase small subunit
MSKIRIEFVLNGKEVSVLTDSNKRLLDMLREDCGMLSVKEGCSEGECGACTVIMNGETVTSCCLLAGQAGGNEIITLEGLAIDGEPNYIQKAFMEAGAVQCGFCTPGMILSAKALLDKNPHPSKEEIKEAMSGNLCRCTGYTKIHKAVENAAKVPEGLRGGGEVHG